MIHDFLFFFSSRRRHTRSLRDWSSDVCSSDLDTLAARGTVFEHAMATSSWTLPSHASLFTGLPADSAGGDWQVRSEEHTSELQSRRDLVCRLLLEKKKKKKNNNRNIDTYILKE